jgi:hypothetical protein
MVHYYQLLEKRMATDKRAVSVYLAPKLYDQVERCAREDGRSISGWIERVMGNYLGVAELRPVGQVQRRADGQVHIEDAIASAVRRGPVKAPARKRQRP